MKWIVLLGFVLTAAAIGSVRFGGLPHSSGAWLDVLFIVAAAGTVGTLIWIIIARLYGAAEAELDVSAPPRRRRR